MNPEIHPGQWRLSRIQLINWGTFNGTLDVPVSRSGALITGGSGTGKSTLIDAISAVLIPTDRVKFNAAAQHEAKRGRGRDLVSYIRGAWRATEDPDSGTVVAQYLRPKATFSVIVLSFSDGQGQDRSLAALYYLRAGANAKSDVQRLFGVFPNQEVLATDFVPFLKKGMDKRGIKREFSGGTFSENHSTFAAKFRPLIGIANTEALLLLQRTQSAKSLESLDDLFRDYMLVEPDTFEYATMAVEQFTDLETAYERVQDIKAQVEVLTPLEELHKTMQHCTKEIERLHGLQAGLPAVRTKLTIDSLTLELSEATLALEQALTEDAEAQEAFTRADDDYLVAKQAFSGETEGLRLRLEQQQAELSRIRARREEFTGRMRRFGITRPITADVFHELKETAQAVVAEQHSQQQRLNEEHSKYAVALSTITTELTTLRREIEATVRSRSNIDARYLELRRRLCEEFNIAETELPFAGELIDVAEHSRDWEPVIQRQLHDFAIQLLVPRRYHKQIVGYINDHHLRLRLKVNSIDTTVEPTPRRVGPASLVAKVTVADHELRPWLHHELAARFDYVCVDTTEELDALPAKDKGVTRQGLVRYAGRSGDRTIRLEKNDARDLGDQRTYRLGSNNQTKLELLKQHQNRLEKDLQAAKNNVATIAAEREKETNQRLFADALAATHWAELDDSGTIDTIDALTQQIEQLSNNPETKALFKAEARAKERRDQASQTARDTAGRVGAARSEVNSLSRRLQEAQEDHTGEVDDNTHTAILELFHAKVRRVTAANVDRLTSEVAAELTKALQRNNNQLGAAGSGASRILAQYIERWPAEKAELEAGPEFTTEALAKLQKLKGERLAEFSTQFRKLINDMSTRNLADIANRLRRAQAEIKERITPVNQSLRSSEFSADRFLRIEVRDIRGEIVLAFQKDLDEAISGGLTQHTDADAEQRYHKIAGLIRRLGSKDPGDQRWRRTVLDTRRHVSFIGVEIDNNDDVVNSYMDSSSLSGGQAQKLVFFCLAAALRYQLATTDAQIPSYATVILDEAFDRADPAYTERAMNVFATFGFHMMLATPLKLINTLSKYVGNTVIVSYTERPGEDGTVRGESSFTTIQPEKLQ